MKLILAVVLLATLIVCLEPVESGKFVFKNRIYHQDPSNHAVYDQHYRVRADNYTLGNPVFLFLGGEAPLPVFEWQEHLPITLARELNGLYIGIEHRFYGESNPANSYATANLKALTSTLALEDAAQFIRNYSATHLPKGTPWVIWGCSYSGALSAWFRSMYPDLVVASIAPSGPVYATPDFSGYLNQFGKVANPACVGAVKEAVKQIDQMLESETGRDKLSKTFHTCKPIPTTPSDQFFFKWTLASSLGSSDQFNNPYAHFPLTKACNIMTSSSNTVSNWATFMGDGCVPVDEGEFIKGLQDVSNPDRSWWYQKCNEFGWFKPSTNNSSIFFDDLPLERMVSWCADIFDIPNMHPNTEQINHKHGGFHVRGSKILFTNGDYDPWHRVSVTKPTGDVQAITYKAGHCAPMTMPFPNDPPSLTAARKTVRNFVLSALKADVYSE